MLPDRYRVRAKNKNESIDCTYHRTRKEAEAKFSELARWDAPEERMYVQLEDSGRERGEFTPISWCDLTKDNNVYKDRK